MRYTYEPDVEAFRKEVRQFIKDNLPPEEERVQRGYEGGGFASNQEEYDYTMGFQKKLCRQGLARHGLAEGVRRRRRQPHAPARLQRRDGLRRRPRRCNMGIAWVGPSLMLYGTDEQKNEVHPPHHRRRRLVVHAL